MGECLSLRTCGLASINIFPLKLKTQVFKGMSAVHSKLWLLFLHMQGSIKVELLIHC